MRPLLLVLALSGCCCALEDPAAHLSAMRAEADKAADAYAWAWLAEADLSPLPPVKIDDPGNPRLKDADAAGRIADLNKVLATFAALRANPKSYGPHSPGDFANFLTSNAPDLLRALALRGTYPATSVETPPAKPAKEHHEPTAVFVNRKD